MKKKQTTNQLLATAYHEAGHLAVAYYLHVPIARSGASIVSDDDSHGRVSFLRTLSSTIESDRSDVNRIRAERRAIVSLAGIEAQRRYRPSSVRNYHASYDHHNAVDVISHFVSGTEGLDAYLRLLRIRARDIVEFPPVWAWIEELALALMEKRTLSRDEILQVIRDADVAD